MSRRLELEKNLESCSVRAGFKQKKGKRIMNKQNVMGKIEDKRLLNIKEVCTYIGIGQTQARKTMQAIGAVRRFGRRILYDKIVIDTYLDNME